ncbi:MAG: hypothetical protein JXR94_06015 [Candidatus Hydrogenedentes bacterium]|nr:hypothetical protein [Candidatus Hydrogenedentota bacterium]
MSYINDWDLFLSDKAGGLFEKGIERIKRIAKNSGWKRVSAEIILFSSAWFVILYLFGRFLTHAVQFSVSMSSILGIFGFATSIVSGMFSVREAKRELVMERMWARLVEDGWNKQALTKLINFIHERKETTFEDIKVQLRFDASIEQIEEIVYHLIRKGAIKGWIDGHSIKREDP